MTEKITFPLKALGAYINGRAFKPLEWGYVGLPIVRIANMNNPTAPTDFFSGDLDDGHRTDTGDILVSWSASLDVYIWDRGPAAVNQHIFKVVPNNELVDKDYLFYVLKVAMRGLSDLVHGATMKHVTRPVFESYEVSIERNKEQQRQIAARLKAQLAEVDKARQAAEVQLRDVEALTNACMRDVFDNTQARAWPIRTVGEISQVSGGIQKTPSRKPVKHFRPFLTVRNVQRGYFDLSVVEQFEITEKELEKYRLEDKDLLIVEGNGSPSHIGRNVLFEDDGQEWVHQNHIIRARLNQAECLPEFASAYLNSEGGKAQMMEKAETTSGLYTLSTSKVMALELPIPPLPVQAEAVDKLQDSLKLTRQIRNATSAQKAEIELLPQKILAQAFEM